MYVLERDPKTRRWVIDDLEVRKKLKHGQTKKTGGRADGSAVEHSGISGRLGIGVSGCSTGGHDA